MKKSNIKNFEDFKKYVRSLNIDVTPSDLRLSWESFKKTIKEGKKEGKKLKSSLKIRIFQFDMKIFHDN